MTTISNQSSYQPPFHYVELKTVRTFQTSVSSSSSLLSSSSFSSSDNENGPTYDVTNSGRMEKSLGNHRGRKKKCSRNTIYPLKLPDFPIKTQCPNCNKFVETHLKYQNGTCVYVCAMGLFALTFALFWVPFFVDSCKDVTHFCPDCKCTLGTKRRI